MSGHCGRRSFRTLHIRFQCCRHEIFSRSRRRRRAACIFIQRNSFLRRRRRSLAGRPDSLGQGGSLSPARKILARNDGHLLSQYRVAVFAPRSFPASLSVQDRPRNSHLGAGVGAHASPERTSRACRNGVSGKKDRRGVGPMNTSHIDAIAQAVLYEGYMLYPYRPSSVKNRQRFNFGVLYPQAYSEAQAGSDAWSMQTECLIHGDSLAALEVRLRFLKLVSRTVRRKVGPAQQAGKTADFETVSMIEADGKVIVPWQEAIECEIALPVCRLDRLSETTLEWKFPSLAKEETELLRGPDGSSVGQIVRKQERIHGAIEVKAVCLAEGPFKVQVRVKNLTLLDGYAAADNIDNNRDAALMRSLISAHVLLGVTDGQFISLLEPPEDVRDLAASCQNVGVW